jgi:hypothetical protein
MQRSQVLAIQSPQVSQRRPFAEGELHCPGRQLLIGGEADDRVGDPLDLKPIFLALVLDLPVARNRLTTCPATRVRLRRRLRLIESREVDESRDLLELRQGKCARWFEQI